MKKHWRITIYAMCISIMLTLAACTSTLYKNHGNIIPDRDATKAFETYQINLNYNYYISGSDVYPNAILGLDKAYNLEPDLWKRVDMTPQKLREFVTDMHRKVWSVDMTLGLHGFAIFDDKGKKIGVWYSILEARTFITMKDDRTAIIITPDIDTYLRHEDPL